MDWIFGITIILVILTVCIGINKLDTKNNG